VKISSEVNDKVYIHGTPQEDTLGTKASYGCIRMRSSDIVEVFNWITVGTEVAISGKPIGRAVKELADDKRLMATNTTKTPGKNRTGSVIEGRAQEKTNTL